MEFSIENSTWGGTLSLLEKLMFTLLDFFYKLLLSGLWWSTLCPLYVTLFTLYEVKVKPYSYNWLNKEKGFTLTSCKVNKVTLSGHKVDHHNPFNNNL